MRMSTIQSLGSSSFGMCSPLRVQECSQIDSSIIMLHANAFDRLPQVFHHPPRRPGSQISRAIIARVGIERAPWSPKSVAIQRSRCRGSAGLTFVRQS